MEGNQIKARSRDIELNIVILPVPQDRDTPHKFRQILNAVESSRHLQAAAIELKFLTGGLKYTRR